MATVSVHAANGAGDLRTGLVRDVLVLAYHAVSDTWPAVTTVTPAELDRQVGHLLARGYVGATFTEALTAPAGRRVLAVTFDDAHRSVLERAKPVLDAHGVPGTVFVPTDYPGSGRPTGWAGFEGWLGTEHEPELLCLDWTELGDLAAAGWEIGSHTCSHPRLSRIEPAARRRELVESRAVIEDRLGLPCRSLAYPYSDVDRATVADAREAGYAVAATVPVRAEVALPLLWPRVGVGRGESGLRFRATTSATLRTVMSSERIGPAVTALRDTRERLRSRGA